MILGRLSCFVAAFALAVSPLSGQVPSQDTLSIDDREAVRTMLDLPMVLSGLSVNATALLDSTSPMCEGSEGRHCISRATLDSDRWPIRKDCDRAGFQILRDAFVKRNARTWMLGSVQTVLLGVSGVEIRAMPMEALRERAPGGWFIEFSAPVYSPDARFVLVAAQGFTASADRRLNVQVFERREASWVPMSCALHLR
jgi:hypothetical protein